ncbi:Hsp20/alpha crystallin family protein [Lacisediminihabitans sp. FW035]
MTTLYPTSRSTRSMPMDLFRDGDNYVMNADLPGIDPATVDIDVDGQVLSIRAERAAASTDTVMWLSRERQSGSFQRRLTLGRNIDTERIAAKYDNGVLTVTIPVTEKSKARKIEVVPANLPESAATSDEGLEVDAA